VPPYGLLAREGLYVTSRLRLLFALLQNFSAIVGPNGSGKSNVIDSMLFVFGYRASKIRSKKISVLIHSSDSHPKVESCTVSVHFQKIIDHGVCSSCTTTTTTTTTTTSSSSTTMTATTTHHHHHFWQAPLRVHSAERRHQSPEWMVLSQVNCVVHIKVTTTITTC